MAVTLTFVNHDSRVDNGDEMLSVFVQLIHEGPHLAQWEVHWKQFHKVVDRGIILIMVFWESGNLTYLSQ